MNYKEILEGVVDIINTAEKSDIGFANICTYIGENCPELKENEKIRRELIDYINRLTANPNNIEKYNTWIAWLEKQGEHVEINPTEFDTRLQALIGKFDSLPKDELIGSLSFWMNVVQNDGTYKDEEKQDEQKSTDEVKSKFKVGDWIISTLPGIKYPHLITDIRNGYYIFEEDDDHAHIASNDNILKLWTIEDAMDGDVLVSRSPFIYGKQCPYGGLNWCNNKFIKASNFIFTDNPVHPATKEQRDLLFQKMHEAGWEFDFDKKELKKISQRMISAEAKEAMYDKPTDLEVFINELSKQFPDVSFAKLSRIAVRVAKWAKPTDEEMKELLRTEYEKGRADTIAEMQKSTWSEEDNKWIENLIQTFEDGYLEGFNQLKSYGVIDWLKSLKDRYTWKPSEEQLDALKRTQTGVIQFSVLQNLYNDLKKLSQS